MRKIVLFLCCLASLLLTCSCGKREMTDEEKKQLFFHYSENYREKDPAKLDSMSDRMLAALSKSKSETDLEFLRVHAYTAKAFAADLRKEKKQAAKFLDSANSILPSLQYSLYYIKAASDVFFMYYKINLDNPVEAEKWLNKLEQLIDQEMASDGFKFSSSEYKRFIYSKSGENAVTRADFLIQYKHDLASAEIILLESLRKQEKWAGNQFFLSQMYGYDLASEISFRKKDYISCSLHAEKCLRLMIRFNQLPIYADLHYYELKMKEKKYDLALKCCRQILNMDLLKSPKMAQIRKKYLIKAAAACKKMKDFKMAGHYQFQADNLSIQPEIKERNKVKSK